MPTKLQNLVINEGSLVDKPANKLARVVLFKRAREPDNGKGESQTTDKPSVLKRIKEGIAKMMGMGDKAMTMDQMMSMQEKEQELYSKEWEYQDAFHASVRSILGDETMDMEKKKEMLTQTMQQYQAKLVEHMQAMMDLMQQTTATTVDKGDPPGSAEPSAPDPVGKSGSPEVPPVKKGDEITVPVTYADVIKSLKPEEAAAVQAEIAKQVVPPKVEISESVTKRLEELEKAAAKVETLEKRATDAEAKAVAAETKLTAEVEKRVAAEYLTKAAQYPTSGTPEQVAAKLRKAYGVSPEFGAEIEADLAKTETLAKDAKLFESVGRSGTLPEGSAAAQIEKLAKAASADRKVSYEKAYDQILQENPNLYKQMRAEEGGK